MLDLVENPLDQFLVSWLNVLLVSYFGGKGLGSKLTCANYSVSREYLRKADPK